VGDGVDCPDKLPPTFTPPIAREPSEPVIVVGHKVDFVERLDERPVEVGRFDLRGVGGHVAAELGENK
jgi:hypothetical protein